MAKSKKIKEENKRIEWVDWLKGFAIILVVIGHFPITSNLKKYLYAFHLPIFFMMSGITFNPSKDKTLKEFIIHKTKGILIPYLCLNISYFWFFCIYNKGLLMSDVSLITIFKGLVFCNNDRIFLLNGPTWLLPTLFLVELAAYLVIKYFGNDKKELAKISLIALVFGYIENVAKKSNSLIWHLNSVPVALFIFFIGYIFSLHYKEDKSLRQKFDNPNLFFGIVLVLLGFHFAKTNGRVSFGGNHYHSMIYTILAFLCSSIGYYIVILKTSKIKIIGKFFGKLLASIGKNTLIILGFHKAILFLIKYFRPNFLSSNIICIVCSILTVLLLYLLGLLVNKFCPFIIGKLEKTKSNIVCAISYCAIIIFLTFKYFL